MRKKSFYNILQYEDKKNAKLIEYFGQNMKYKIFFKSLKLI